LAPSALADDRCEIATAEISDPDTISAFPLDLPQEVGSSGLRPLFSIPEDLPVEALRTAPTENLRVWMEKSKSPFSRLKITRILSERLSPEALDFFERAYAAEPTGDVKRALLEAVSNIKTPEAEAFISRAQRDAGEYPEVAEFFFFREKPPDLKGTATDPRQRRVAKPHPETGDNVIVPALPSQELLKDAARAANAVYSNPDARISEDARELANRYVQFQDNALPGYIPQTPITDPRTGLKAALFIPEKTSDAGESKPAMLAFAGTHNYATALADGNLGYEQSRSPVLEPAYAMALRALRSGEDFYVVGHSLGGGLAQRFGAELKRRLEADANFQIPENREKFGHIQVVTFNSFGVKERLLSERDSPNPPSEFDSHYRGTNLRLQGDYVSPIGRPTGSPFITLPSPPGVSPIGRHYLAPLQRVLDEFPVTEETPYSPPTPIPGAVTGTRVIGWITEMNQRQRFKAEIVDITRRLTEAQRLYTVQRGFRDLKQNNRWLDPELKYIAEVARSGEIPAARREEVLQILFAHEVRMKRLLSQLQQPRY